MISLLVALAGGLGAVTRFVVDAEVGRRASLRLPVGTALINITGSFLLGFVTGWWSFHTGDPAVRAILGTGFLGGYTTFSTTSGDGFRLLREGHPLLAAANLFGGLALGVLAALGGLLLGAVLTGSSL